MRSITRDFFLVMVALFLWSLGEGLFLHFQPIYIQSFGADPAQIGAVIGIAGAVLALCHLPAGYIADHFGRKPVMVAGWILGLFAALIMAAAASLWVFTVGLVLYNATAFVVAANNSYITAARGRLSVERTITFTAVAYGAGSILSPALGGLIAGVWGLRADYIVACVVFTLSCVVMASISSQKTVHASEGGRYAKLLANADYRKIVLLYFGAICSMYLGMALAPNFLRDARLLSLENIGLLGTANAVGVVSINAVIGRWHPRIGFLISQVLFLLYGVLLWKGAGLGFFLVAYALRAGFSGMRSSASSQAGRVVASHEMGMAYAILETVAAVGLMLAPAAAGLLYEIAPEMPIIVSLILVCGMIILTLAISPKRRLATD